MASKFVEKVPSLQTLCMRAKSLCLFEAFLDTHIARIENVNVLARNFVNIRELPPDLRKPMQESLKAISEELQRWWKKHGELFSEKKANRSQHLLLWLDCVVWDSCSVMINDRETAVNIIKRNNDWPQMQFQLAAAYALEDVIVTFDRIYLRVFRTRLADHPLYDLWNIYLNKEVKKNPSEADVFEYMGLAPRHTVVACFTWALHHGFFELLKFIWFKVTECQREYLGMLQWRQLCSRVKCDPPAFTFLAKELYAINSPTVSRITSQIFLCKVRRALEQKRGQLLMYIPKLPSVYFDKDDRFRGLTFLLEKTPSALKRFLLSSDSFFAFSLAIQHKDMEMLQYLCGYLEPTQRKPLFARISSEFDPLMTDRIMPLILNK